MYDLFPDSFCTWCEVGVGVPFGSYGWFFRGYSPGKRLGSQLITTVHFPKAINPVCSDHLWGLSSTSFMMLSLLYCRYLRGCSKTAPACLHLCGVITTVITECKNQGIEALQFFFFVRIALASLESLLLFKSVAKLPFSWYFDRACIWSLSVMLNLVLY